MCTHVYTQEVVVVGNKFTFKLFVWISKDIYQTNAGVFFLFYFQHLYKTFFDIHVYEFTTAIAPACWCVKLLRLPRWFDKHWKGHHRHQVMRECVYVVRATCVYICTIASTSPLSLRVYNVRFMPRSIECLASDKGVLHLAKSLSIRKPPQRRPLLCDSPNPRGVLRTVNQKCGICLDESRVDICRRIAWRLCFGVWSIRVLKVEFVINIYITRMNINILF